MTMMREQGTYTLVSHGSVGRDGGLEATLLGVGDRVNVAESAHGCKIGRKCHG